MSVHTPWRILLIGTVCLLVAASAAAFGLFGPDVGVDDPSWSVEDDVAVSLVSGEATLTAVDQLIPGRGLDVAVVRVYRSLTLGYGPLGSAGWHSPLFAHLSESKATGVVAYHDGTGRVYRFIPVQTWRRHHPEGLPEGYEADGSSAYLVPSGLHLRLVKRSSGWVLYDRENNSISFDEHGRMTAMADRHCQGRETTGNTLRFSHNAMGRLLRLVDDLGRTYHFAYFDDPRPAAEGGDGIRYGLLKCITDFAGRTIDYEFDDHRRLVKVRLPAVSNPIEHYASYSYTGDNRPTITYRYEPAVTVTSEDDNTTAVLHGRFAPLRLEGFTLPGSAVLRVRLEYAAATGRTTTVAFPTPTNQNTSAASVPWRFEYPNEPDAAAPATLVHVYAPWKQRTAYTLAHGRVTQVVEPAVPTLAAADQTPGVDGTLPLRTLTTTYAYEADGRLQRISYPDGGSTRYDYATGTDRLGRMNVATLTRTADGQDAVTTFSYGPDRVLSGQTDPEGRAITYPVASNGAQPAPTGYAAEGVLSTATFDTYGRLTKTETTGPAPEEAVYQYGSDHRGADGGGLLQSVTARGMTQTFDYDDRDFISTRSTSFGTSTTYRRDDWGRIVEMVAGQSNGTYRAVNATVQRAYDAAGHVVRERRQQTGVGWIETAWTYNEREQVTRMTQTGLAGSEPGAKALVDGTTTYAYDTYGRLLTTTSPGQVVTTRDYDAAGRVAAVQAAGSGSHRRGYDELGRLIWTTDGDEGVWRRYFDKLGNVTGEQMPSGAFIERAFDRAGGIRRRSVYADSSMAALLTETRHATTSFGSIGSSVQLVSGGGSSEGTITTIRSFDGAGRVSAITTTAGDQHRVTDFAYQAASGLLASSTSAVGVRTEYVYEHGSRWPDRIVTREPGAGAHPAIVVETSIARDALGRAVRRETAGTVTELTLDEAGNVLASAVGGARRTAATYDGWGSPVSVRQPAIGGEVRYGYDPDGRLLSTAVAREGGYDEVTAYTYDGTGRLDSRIRPGSATERFAYYPDDTLESWTTTVRSQSGHPLVITHHYDEANHLVARTLNREAFEGSERPAGLAALDFGDSFVYDPLGRPLSLAKKTGIDAVDPETMVSYQDYDTRGLPRLEQTGTRPSLERRYDAFGNPETVLLPQGIAGSMTSGGYSAVFDHNGRMTAAAQSDSDGMTVPGSAFSATFGWMGARSLGIATATGLGATLSYQPRSGRLAALDVGSFGAFSFTWNDTRTLKVGRSVSPGNPDIVGGLTWSAAYDQEDRQTGASVGADGILGHWTYGYGKADELLFRVEQSAGREGFTAGVSGRIEARTSVQGTTTLRYDAEGRRIEDDDCLYTWSWRGQLVQVDFKAAAPQHAGERFSYTYDASGRLLERTRLGLADQEGERPFVAAKALTWDGQRLAAEAGLNFEGAVLWRSQYLPGPLWLDDAPLVRVETGLQATPSTGTYTLVRDEMGTALAVVEHSTGQSPVLRARYLGSAYGQTRVELGPELVRIVFDPTVSTLGDDAQEPIAEESVAGALVIHTTLTLASSSLEEGLLIDRWSGTDWRAVPRSALAIGADPSNSTALLVMRLPAWPKGERYRITLTPALTDEFGRALQLANDHQVILEVPEDGMTPPWYERVFEITRDTAVAATNTLNGAFPGGQPIGFQGAWTDAATGLTYHRRRWFDPKTASWLSRDPAGNADSLNQYAFVGWAPFQAIDPLGESVRVHLYTKHSGLTSAQLAKLASLIEEYFLRLPWYGSPDASSSVLPFSFEDYESAGTILPPRGSGSYAPRSMEITRPPGLIHAADYYLKYPKYIQENRDRAAALGFDFHVHAELSGPASASFKSETAQNSGEGGYNAEGRAYVLERPFAEVLSIDSSLKEAHGEYLQLLYLSMVTAHELGHSFGLSPEDSDAMISGIGVMATRETLGAHFLGFLKKLSELADRRGGYEALSERDIAEVWFSIFRFSDYDAKWILNLADPR